MKRTNNEKRSFGFYDSFLEAMKHLDDREFRECVMKIRNYALDGDEMESEHPMVNIILAMAKPNLDAARRRYMASVENGRKGAEYGKLGGAPKGNQNARKKQPLKQPLDVDANDNVDVEEDVNDNEDVDAAVDGVYALRDFPTSSISSLSKEIENDSERFGEREEKEEPPLEEQSLQSNDSMVGTASEEKEEKTIYSKCDIDDSAPASTHSVEGAGCSAARPQPKKESGMDIGEYYEKCLARCTSKLIDMRLGNIPKDDSVFWRAVDFYSQLYGVSDRDKAARQVSYIVSKLMQQSR